MSLQLTVEDSLSDIGVAALLVQMAMLGVTDPAQVAILTSSPPLLEHHGHAERLDGADEQLPIQPVALPVQAPSHFSGGRGRYIYVVFHGRIPGVYGDWLLASPQISGFSGNIHQKYTSEAEANAAYQYAASRGLIRGDDITTTTLPPPYSVVSDERDAIAAARAISPGKEIVKFYVVNPGRRPGIYASLVEATMAVNGVSGGQWFLYSSFRAASRSWARIVASNSVDIRSSS